MCEENQIYFHAIDANNRELFDHAIKRVDPRDNWQVLYYAMNAHVRGQLADYFMKTLLKYSDDTVENCRLIFLFAYFIGHRAIMQKYLGIIMRNNESVGLRDIPIDGLCWIDRAIFDSFYESAECVIDFSESFAQDPRLSPMNFHKNLMFFTESSWICLATGRMIAIMCNEAQKSRDPAEYFSAIIYLAVKSNPYTRELFMRLMKSLRIMISKKMLFVDAILRGVAINLRRYCEEYCAESDYSDVRLLSPKIIIGQLRAFANIPLSPEIIYAKMYQDMINSAMSSAV